MRLRISHQTSYRYQAPAASVIQMLRLTPRNHDGQYVARWRVDVSIDCRLDQHEDAFGNISHAFTADGPFGELTVLAQGEVETRDTEGAVRGAVERFPPALFLRETPLTAADAGIAEFAAAARAGGGDDVLAVLHRLLGELHTRMACARDLAPPMAQPAAEAFARRAGHPRDLAHVFIAAARSLGIPARYVSGYVCADEAAAQDAAAWAEAHVGGLGWVAFDPANGVCATDAHVRLAMGLDCLNAAPLRGTRYGGAGEAQSVTLAIAQAAGQQQS
jgi:transglutaminase-like putative cysteine protease